MEIVVAALCAALIGAAGPLAIGRLPEPDNADSDKVPYAELARLPGLAVLLAGVAALGAGIVAWRIEKPELIATWVVLCGVGAWLSYVDARTQLLPRKLTDPLTLLVFAIIALTALVTGDWRLLLAAVIGGVVTYVVFRLIYELGRFFRGGAFGYGDVRLSVVLGMALAPLGLSTTFVGLYAGFILGVLIGMPLALLGVLDRKGIAFGPYLVAGAVVGVVWPTIVG